MIILIWRDRGWTVPVSFIGGVIVGVALFAALGVSALGGAVSANSHAAVFLEVLGRWTGLVRFFEQNGHIALTQVTLMVIFFVSAGVNHWLIRLLPDNLYNVDAEGVPKLRRSGFFFIPRSWWTIVFILMALQSLFGLFWQGHQ